MYAMKRISNLKFIVKNISMSSSQSLPGQNISDCAKNPLVGLEKKEEKNHHHQVLEIEKKKEGCRGGRPQVKYSTWDEILRKTKRIDYVDDDDMPTKQHQHMMMLPGPDQELSHSAVFKGSSPSPQVNLKAKPPLVMDNANGFKSLKTHQGDDPSSTAKPNKTVSAKPSTSKPKKTINVVPKKSADVPVRRKSNHHDSHSRHMQFKADKASVFPSKRPRNQDDDDNETSALKLKRRKTTLTSSGVKPKPAESPQTSANRCQTVVSGCRISKKAVDSVNVSSDASSVINILPADKQPKAVVNNAAAHSNTIRETSPQDDDCDISPIIDEDTRKAWLPATLWKMLSFITRKGELPGSPWRR